MLGFCSHFLYTTCVNIPFTQSTVYLFVSHVGLLDTICRSNYPPAELYPAYAEKSTTSLLERFKSMQIEGNEDPTENGQQDHEVGNANFLQRFFY